MLHNKVGCHALYLCIGQRPYAMGAGWQGGALLTSFHFHKALAPLKHPSYSCPTQRVTVLCGALQYEFHRL